MHLFIYSEIYDTHAICIKAALERIGVRVTRFLSNQIPAQASISTFIDENSDRTEFFTSRSLYQSDDIVDVVWLRRPALPIISGLELHTDDIEIIDREWKECWQSFIANSFPDASWINPWLSAKKTRSKLVQLMAAKQVGLSIPKTLVSNNSGDIRSFIERNSSGRGTIVKSFLPVHWKEGTSSKVMYAARVDASMLPSDSMLRSVPAIYQERISKSFEVRSTFFGDICHSAKLVAEKDGAILQDWRLGHYSGLVVEPYSLPKSIEDKCRKLMSMLGLKFGCFDFIVSPDKEFIFLEVNEAGQFLWVESHCPEIKMINAFCEFVLSEGKISNTKHRLPDFSAEEVGQWAEVQSVLNEEKKLYVSIPQT